MHVSTEALPLTVLIDMGSLKFCTSLGQYRGFLRSDLASFLSHMSNCGTEIAAKGQKAVGVGFLISF